jgi:nicotinate-nucleotide adenylyltransferase
MVPAGAVGILGGTFDPIHKGHLAAARQLLAQAGVAEIWLMPNSLPPHRPVPPEANAQQRLAMAALAVSYQSALLVSDLEVRRGGVSYTIDTVRQLRARYPDGRFTWLIGSDAAAHLRDWHESGALLRESHFTIFNRPGGPPLDDRLLAQQGLDRTNSSLISIETLPIAAREVRSRLHAGKDVAALVPPAVLEYIVEHGLYGRGSASGQVR